MLGFLVVTAGRAASVTRVVEAPRKERLISLIQQRRSQIGDLDDAVRDLRSQLRREEATRSRSSRATAEQARKTATLAAQAGASTLKGPGLRVKVSDAETIPADVQEAGAYRISDTDLQLLVNALWSAGAEAIALNGNRLVATTSIRAAGETVVVNFRPLSPPYRIEAIGADEAGFARTDIARRMRRWRTLFGLGFSTTHVDKLTLAPYTGRVGIAVATPGEGG
jgi:uncharacterized protein YlxW (UPF0749 family)